MQILRRALVWTPVAVAVALFLAPIEPALVERVYSDRLYLQFQPRLTRFSNQLPFAAFDLILALTAVMVLGVVLAAIVSLRRAPWWRVLGTAVVRMLAIGALLYIWFLGVWGFNYRRVPLIQRLELARGAATPEIVRDLGRQAVDRLNALHAAAHAAAWVDPVQDVKLQEAFRTTQGLLGSAQRAAAGRLKSSVIGPYFRWASVDGMIDPFALEVLANPDLLPFEKPFVAGHEWAHLAGYADESEASFVGFLTCMRAGVASQYSAWLFLYWEVSSGLPSAERAAQGAALAAGPRADVAAVAERVRRGQLPRLRRVSWAAYDQYLKANHVEEGVRSYDAVITLLSRARFKDGWVPVPLGAVHDAPGGRTP